MSKQRLIDANALETSAYEIYVHASPEFKTRMNTLKELIDQAPTIDAVEVVHAKWVWTQRGWCCSACSKPSLIEAVAFAKWCPRCGAKMDGGVE